MKPRHSPNRVWGEPLLHPLCLLSMAVWWLNDHVGKVYVPSALTGKVSDVACLVVFPLWTWCLLDGVASWGLPKVYGASHTLRSGCLYGVTGAIAVWFALINVSHSVGAIHRDLWSALYAVMHAGLAKVGNDWPPNAHHTVDAADLFTLPAALFGIRIGRTWLDGPGRRGASNEQTSASGSEWACLTACSALPAATSCR